MSHFIFPVIIESRKILFLDLEPQSKNSDLKNVGEDVYIIKLPEISEKTILSIPKSRLIQSLHVNVEDINIKDVSFSFQYDEQVQCLKVTAGINKPKVPWQETELFDGLFLKAEEDDSSLELKISRSHQSETLRNDHIYIQFLLNPGNSDLVYAASIKLFLADKKDISYAGFDFGSEASQMCEADYKAGGNELGQKEVNLFADVKSRLGGVNKDEEYMQYENRKLYKSIFFAKQVFSDDTFDPAQKKTGWILPSGSINALTLKNVEGAFFNHWVQIPNLKLLYDNPSVANSISFNISARERAYAVDLINIRSSLYASLLKEILVSYLIKRIFADVYLHFTLLVPNIYSIGEIRETKKIIRSIVYDVNNSFHKHIKGLEISSLSESDAAFLGCMSTFTVKSGSYYINIDCGKGTTDFSIIQFEGNDSYKSIYRNGFAGAGNLITFGVLQSVLHYLKQSQQNANNAANFEAFKNVTLSKESFFYPKLELSLLADKWKRAYDSGLTQQQIEDEWRTARSEDLNIENLFARRRDFAEVFSFLGKINHVHDWGGFIDSAINNIIGKIHGDLSQIVRHMKSPCGGILLTGRGFLFTPLQEATKTIIKSIKGMENVEFIDTRNKDLKEICLEGVFVRNILSYSDIASTPIEIDKKTQKQILPSDINPVGFFRKVLLDLLKLADKEGEYFDEETNSLKILNTDFAECQFLVGNKKYHPEHIVKDIAGASLVQSRKGLFIKASTVSGKKVIVPLTNIIQKNKVDLLMVEKSLFPGWFDPNLLES
jgi:hypothetical protein